MALTAESDLYIEIKWTDIGIESRTFEDVVITDFEVLDTGARIAETYNCVRTLLNKVFMDGFEG